MFTLPDLVIESVIRDGFANLKARPEIIDSLFADLTKPYANRKYGSAEVEKIKTFFTTGSGKEVSIAHSFHLKDAALPCVSIQLGSDSEDQRLANLEDYQGFDEEPLVAAADLAQYVKVSAFLPSSYDSITGKVNVPDGFNLSSVYTGFIYEDGSENEFTIKSGISNDLGNKFFFIDPNQIVNIAQPGILKSFLNSEVVEIRGTHSNVSILIGIHTKDALTTKYLYTIIKFFLLSRKKDLINRCFIVSSISGSDFTRDMRYEGDTVFNRFLTVTGKVSESWRSDEVDLIDSVAADVEIADCD